MADTKWLNTAERCESSQSTYTGERNINSNKNFKEDDLRNSVSHRISRDFSDIKSEISEGRRFDLDEDADNYFNYNHKGKRMIKIIDQYFHFFLIFTY